MHHFNAAATVICTVFFFQITSGSNGIPCQLQHFGVSGVIRIPSLEYKSAFCVWVIKTPPDYSELTLHISHLRIRGLRSDSYCYKEHIEIVQHVDGVWDYRSSFCENTRNRTVTAYGNHVQIRVHGYAHTWKHIAMHLSWTARRGCRELQKGLNGVIKLPNVPKSYPKEIRCVWIIEAPKGTNRIKLDFLTASLSGSMPGCGEGYLMILDGKEKPVGRYCGANFPQTNFVPGSLSHVVLRSSQNTTDKGFYFTWKAEKAEEPSCGVPAFYCDKHQRMRRFVNGEEQNHECWPWLVKVSFWSTGNTIWRRSTCGGVLVDPSWVLTAAHCVTLEEPRTNLHVYAQSGFSFNDLSGTELRVLRVIRHPQYRDQFRNDIALIQLLQPVTINERVRTICLPDRDGFPKVPIGSDCWMAGWGRTSNDISPFALQALHGGILRYRGSCPAPYSSQICSGSVEENVGACEGDSGSPLMYKSKQGVFYAIGVLSHGPTACGQGLDAFESTRRHLRWIHGVMRRHSQ